MVIADIGDALFAASELVIRQQTEFISPAYYTSMGFAVPAALGRSVRPARSPRRRDLRRRRVPDDRHGTVHHRPPRLRPIVIVLDNTGYGTERFLHPGDWQFNEIHPWQYSKLPEVLGGGSGYEVRTEGEFDEALRHAWEDRTQREPDPRPPERHATPAPPCCAWPNAWANASRAQAKSPAGPASRAVEPVTRAFAAGWAVRPPCTAPTSTPGTPECRICCAAWHGSGQCSRIPGWA